MIVRRYVAIVAVTHVSVQMLAVHIAHCEIEREREREGKTRRVLTRRVDRSHDMLPQN